MHNIIDGETIFNFWTSSLVLVSPLIIYSQFSRIQTWHTQADQPFVDQTLVEELLTENLIIKRVQLQVEKLIEDKLQSKWDLLEKTLSEQAQL